MSTDVRIAEMVADNTKLKKELITKLTTNSDK